MNRFGRLFIRISAFLRKEIFTVLRQPRLVMSLVLGPFLILLLFGVGYRNQAPPLRTIFVAPEGSPVGRQIEEFATNLGPQLIFEGVTSDLDGSLRRLRRGELDVVAVAPENPYQSIRNNEQAIFILYHNEIDPLRADYVRYFGRIYIDEVNRRVLRSVTEQGQSEAQGAVEDVRLARTSADALSRALDEDNGTAAVREQTELNEDLNDLDVAINSSISLLEGVEETVGPDDSSDVAEVRARLDDIRADREALATIDENLDDYSAEAERVERIKQNLETLEGQLATFQEVQPAVLVSPFGSDTQGINATQPQVTDYFAPAVIVLLLQHLGVTFGALSIVRERLVGAMELFSVSPLSPGETLVGKYLGYMALVGMLGVILTLLMVFGLRVPQIGPWEFYIAIIAALIFTSLSIGIVISCISETDTQAVQYSMIVLLTSVFFSGAFLNLGSLWAPVRAVSWAVPATYGIILLQNNMLRGYIGLPHLLLTLVLIGLILFIVAWFLLRRLMKVIR